MVSAIESHPIRPTRRRALADAISRSTALITEAFTVYSLIFSAGRAERCRNGRPKSSSAPRIGRVVRPKPLLQRHRRDVRFAFLYGQAVLSRQTVEYDQSLTAATGPLSDLYLATVHKLIVCRFTHDLQKFRLRNTKYVVKILHLSFSVLPCRHRSGVTPVRSRKIAIFVMFNYKF